jgi:hypothetical protein
MLLAVLLLLLLIGPFLCVVGWVKWDVWCVCVRGVGGGLEIDRPLSPTFDIPRAAEAKKKGGGGRATSIDRGLEGPRSLKCALVAQSHLLEIDRSINGLFVECVMGVQSCFMIVRCVLRAENSLPPFSSGAFDSLAISTLGR